MRFIALPIVFLCMILFLCGCDAGGKKNEGSGAPGSGKSGTKIDFKYDPKAKQEWLRVTKGQREGSHTDVYVGDTKTGTLSFGTIVQKIGEEKGWYKIRYYSENNDEFFGFIKYTDAEPTTRRRERINIPVGEDAEPKVYTYEVVEEKLNQILRVPYKLKVVQEQPEVKTEKVFASAGTPDGFDDLSILQKFKGESQSYVYADKIFKELAELRTRSPYEYQKVIDLYGLALQSYKEKNYRFFENYLDEANKKRDYYRGSFK
jgi:hypothetical protein